MTASVKLFPEVQALAPKDLRDYIKSRAELIARQTPPDSDWDDTEEWLIEAVELAHAVIRAFRVLDGEEMTS